MHSDGSDVMSLTYRSLQIYDNCSAIFRAKDRTLNHV